MTKDIHSHSSKISIRRIGRQDLEQVGDVYYRHLSGDFVGSCGRRVLMNYLKSLLESGRGSLWCAITEDSKIIGFSVGLIDKNQFNRKWIFSNIAVLLPLVIVRFIFLRSFRTFVYNRVRDTIRAESSFAENVGCIRKTILAYSMWAAVDEDFRSKGYRVAERLLTSLEADVKDKGATSIYSFVNRTNLASIFMHMKNGWKVIDKNEKRFKLAKEL